MYVYVYKTPRFHKIPADIFELDFKLYEPIDFLFIQAILSCWFLTAKDSLTGSHILF